MRRVFVLINNSGIGGAERRFGRLFATHVAHDASALWIINAGLFQHLMAGGIVTGACQARIWRLSEPFGWLVERLGLRQSRWSFWLKKLDYVLFMLLFVGRLVTAWPRTIHLVLGGAYIAIPLMLLRPGHRFVISMTNPDLAGLVGVSWARGLYRWALRQARVIDCLTDRVKSGLQAEGLDGAKMLVSEGSVVDVTHFRPPVEKADWVVFAARLIEEKNPRLFIEAIPTVLKMAPHARIFLLGEGPLASVLDQDLRRLGLDTQVMLGFHQDLAPILGRARVFVSLQRIDNYPSQSLLEAMACGAAVVATDVGLTRKLVDQDTGLLVAEDPEDVAHAIIALLKDPDRCRRLGEAGRSRVSGLHSAKAYLSYMDRLYARVEAQSGWASVGTT